MRYASYRLPNGTETWGIVDGEDLVDLGPSGLAVAPSLKAALADGILGGSRLDAPQAKDRTPVSEVELLPPVPDPGKIICIGVNYKTHMDEGGKAPVAAPTIFTRFADSQIGHGAAALRPASTSKFDYEGELALVIGRDAWEVDEAEAFDYVAGYSAYNDFSVRDWQLAASQWTPGKNFPGTGAFGPYLVTGVENVDELQLTTKVNGEVRQSARLSDLIFSIPQILAYVTSFTRLSVGDVIVTGTPGGVGLFMDPPGLLHDGDVVEVQIDQIGTLVNRVKQLS